MKIFEGPFRLLLQKDISIYHSEAELISQYLPEDARLCNINISAELIYYLIRNQYIFQRRAGKAGKSL